jgi:hypothetical protein
MRDPKPLIEQVRDVDMTLADSVYTMTDEELKSKVVTIANEDAQIVKTRKEDSDLKSLNSQVSEAKKSYSVPLKNNDLKRQLCLQVLTERGKLA